MPAVGSRGGVAAGWGKPSPNLRERERGRERERQMERKVVCGGSDGRKACRRSGVDGSNAGEGAVAAGSRAKGRESRKCGGNPRVPI